jgi:hypothetical protein
MSLKQNIRKWLEVNENFVSSNSRIFPQENLRDILNTDFRNTNNKNVAKRLFNDYKKKLKEIKQDTTKEELTKRARELGIYITSRMTKNTIRDKINKKQREEFKQNENEVMNLLDNYYDEGIVIEGV